MVEGELISRQMRALAEMENSGLVPLMEADKYEDLGRMYELFKRVEGGLDLMRQVRTTCASAACSPSNEMDVAECLCFAEPRWKRLLGC